MFACCTCGISDDRRSRMSMVVDGPGVAGELGWGGMLSLYLKATKLVRLKLVARRDIFFVGFQ